MPVNKKKAVKKRCKRRKLFRTALKNLNQQRDLNQQGASVDSKIGLSDIDGKIAYYENLLKRL